MHRRLGKMLETKELAETTKEKLTRRLPCRAWIQMSVEWAHWRAENFLSFSGHSMCRTSRPTARPKVAGEADIFKLVRNLLLGSCQ